MQKFKAYTFIVFINLALFFLFSEGIVLLVFKSPQFAQHLPEKLFRSFQYLYGGALRSVIQMTPECGQYDSELFYTLKSGSCTFENLEFKTSIFINSLGVRDDEDSLQGPKIVTLGDSYAMGWGVEQNESFTQVLEKKLNKKALNTAISSYGTVRELKLLNRVDTSNLQWIVLQYFSNDIFENETFYKNKNNLPIQSEQMFLGTQSDHRYDLRYKYPGMYTIKLLRQLFEFMAKPQTVVQTPIDSDHDKELDQEVFYFLNALANASSKDLKNTRWIVFEAEPFGASPRHFIERLNFLKNDSRWPEYVRNLITLDLKQLKKQENFFIFDEHYSAKGHQALAEIIAKKIMGSFNTTGSEE